MKLVLLILIAFFSTAAFAQGDIVKVYKDPRMEVLSQKQAELNKRSKTVASRGIRSGYRIQVYNAQDRVVANAVKSELLRRFPDQKTYLLYQAPNFRVRIGNFLSQKDASQLRKMIAALYPDRGIFVVADRVEYNPPIDED
ncbi:SPOR domain-containing protein [Aridibaculum aurantiacum]|uniref:SPOR domain-containing protein n=1 Tax=Aridibaculum aurantiacum TaxID=2810307 RepID=UPI001A9693C9|nr:SPOR domain-containing protein [Aridibaculum aurantiacum]